MGVLSSEARCTAARVGCSCNRAHKIQPRPSSVVPAVCENRVHCHKSQVNLCAVRRWLVCQGLPWGVRNVAEWARPQCVADQLSHVPRSNCLGIYTIKYEMTSKHQGPNLRCCCASARAKHCGPVRWLGAHLWYVQHYALSVRWHKTRVFRQLWTWTRAASLTPCCATYRKSCGCQLPPKCTSALRPLSAQLPAPSWCVVYWN